MVVKRGTIGRPVVQYDRGSRFKYASKCFTENDSGDCLDIYNVMFETKLNKVDCGPYESHTIL